MATVTILLHASTFPHICCCLFYGFLPQPWQQGNNASDFTQWQSSRPRSPYNNHSGKGGKRRPLSFHLTFVCSISLFCRRCCLLPHKHIGPSKAERKSPPCRSVAQIETRMTGREFQMKIDAMPPSKRRARGERLISRLRPPLVLWRGKKPSDKSRGFVRKKEGETEALASSPFAQRNGDAQRYSLSFLARGKKRRFIHNTRIHIPL